MKSLLLVVLLLGLACACAPHKQVLQAIQQSENTLQNHVGFALFDPQSNKMLVQHQADKYFTPASNTKIFTFYAALRILGDSAIAFKYLPLGDSVIVWGMGDPSFLYKNVYSNTGAYQFLQSLPGKIYFSGTNFYTESLGPGWAWDDSPYAYQAERSAFPVYGNLVEVEKKGDAFSTMPPYFMQHFTVANQQHEREEVVRGTDDNQLTYFTGKRPRSKWTIPFRSSPDVVLDLLSDTLKREVLAADILLSAEAKTRKSIPTDSLYKVMMQDSDNFIAEQLLLQCAGVLGDSLKPEITIAYVTKNWLADLPDKPQWVDGSGLSRYNLFTPRSITALWNKIYQLVPQQRLFDLVAAGGKSGTLKNWYKNETPYIFGKTGTLSNNHVVSGFLRTRKGKIFIFSLMNNNYLASTNEVRKHMEKILFTVYNKY